MVACRSVEGDADFSKAVGVLSVICVNAGVTRVVGGVVAGPCGFCEVDTHFCQRIMTRVVVGVVAL